MRLTEYRVVETSTVTDENLTVILNRETRAGWTLDGIHFVPHEGSKRPRMAFVVFTQERESPSEIEAPKAQQPEN